MSTEAQRTNMSQVKMVRGNLGKGSVVGMSSDSLLGHTKDGKPLKFSHERWDFHVACAKVDCGEARVNADRQF